MLSGVNPSPTSARRVVVIVFDRFQSLDAFGPIEVFDHASTAVGRPLYDIQVVAAGPRPAPATPRPVRASNGVAVLADAPLADTDATDLDTMLIAGGNGVYDLLDDPDTTAHVRRLAGGARRVASVCTGAYLLAEAGLLDRRRATTHWLSCEHLAGRYPDVEVDPEPIFVRDGPVSTSAGVTAGMDLALDFVEEDHGHPLALDVARSLVLFLRRPGTQAQLSGALSGQLAITQPLRDLHEWVLDHLDAELTVDRLAARAHQSPRTFARRFRAEVGMTPARWVEALRLEQARRLLEETPTTVDEVARRCGLGPESFRRLFHRHLGVSPREYRRRFGSPDTSASGRTSPTAPTQPARTSSPTTPTADRATPRTRTAPARTRPSIPTTAREHA
jgi:transcriptional regulator GlxA family with amidase domain